MVDMTLRAYTESGAAVSPSIYIHLDIILTAEPGSAPDVKSLTPLHTSTTYSIFLRQPGTKWTIRGVQVQHRGDMSTLQDKLRYLFKITNVGSNVPQELQALHNKYVRVLAMKTTPSAKKEVLEWSINCQEVSTL